MGKPGSVRCPGGSPGYKQEHLGRWKIMRELEKSILWARCWDGPFIRSLPWEQGWERATGATPGALVGLEVGRVSERGRILQGGQPG